MLMTALEKYRKSLTLRHPVRVGISRGEVVSNDMRMQPFDSPFYALVAVRVWWKPWRWNLIAYELTGPPYAIATNLLKSQLVDFLKVIERDF